MQTIAIIGAGITGLACAAKLKAVGLDPIVYDKGRGIGGRMATRRTNTGLQFDHGAQHIRAKSSGFQTVLDDAERVGMVSQWDLGDHSRYVGTPGMNGLAKYLAQGITVHQKAHVTRIHETEAGCNFLLENEILSAAKLVVTVPAPQAIDLLGGDSAFLEKIASVEIDPCLTLMVAFDKEVTASFVSRRAPDDPISWLALDSNKPGRATRNCWVAQASPSWSKQHLEGGFEQISDAMLPLVCERLGTKASNVIHVAAHRWRYAAVSKPLGKPFMKNEGNNSFSVIVKNLSLWSGLGLP